MDNPTHILIPIEYEDLLPISGIPVDLSEKGVNKRIRPMIVSGDYPVGYEDGYHQCIKDLLNEKV